MPLAALYASFALGEEGHDAGLGLFFLPILVSAWVGGLRPGLVATAVSAILADYFLLEPRHTFSIARNLSSLGWLNLIVTGTLMSCLVGLLRRSSGVGSPSERGSWTSTERWVRTGFAAALSLVAAIGALSYANAVRQEDHDRQAQLTEDVITELRAVLSSITDVETAQRGYTITGNDAYLAPMVESELALPARLQRLRAMTSDEPAQRKRIDALVALSYERLEFSRRLVRLRREEGFEAAQAVTVSGEGRRLQVAIRGAVAELEGVEQDRLKVREAHVRQASLLTRTGIVTGSALAFAFVAVALFTIGRKFADSRRAEAALREARDQLEARVRERTAEVGRSYENFRLLVQQAPISIAMFDRDMRYLATSQRWIEEYGRGHPDLIGRSHYDVHPDVPEVWKEAHRRGQAGEVVKNDEDYWQQADGSRHWLRWAIHPWRDAGGEVGGIIISAEDITPRKRAEEELRQREALLSRTSRLAHVGGWEFEVPTLEGTWTEETARIHDLEPGQETSVALGLSVFEAASRDAIEKAVREAIELARPYDLELELTTAKGVRKWVRTVGVPVVENDRVVRVQGAIQDVTDRRRAEDAIRALNAELEQRVAERTAELAAKNRELETFTYSVSHDLKAPLRGIDGYSRLLLDDHADRLGEEGRTFVGNVRQGVAQMGRLIDDLLAYSRLERRTFQLTPVDLRDLVDRILQERAEDVRARDATLTVDVPSATVSADGEGLAMALRNLIDNALKFSAGVPRPTIAIGARESSDRCILWVRDNGVGFDMRFHDRIFEIFQRLHRSEDFPGTGVGLAIVRKAMERMGGRAWAESEPGKGASFFLEIPR